MEKIDLKKLYTLYACLNIALAGIYVLFLRGNIQGFPSDQAVGFATGAILLASILICSYAAWGWNTNSRMIKQMFRICFWAFCALTYGQALSAGRLTQPYTVLVQPLLLLVLLGEGVLAGVVIRFQEEELGFVSSDDMNQSSEHNEDPYVLLVGKILTGLGGFVFYWLTWADLWDIL
jgi:predicted Kef-type K+ transport protein